MNFQVGDFIRVKEPARPALRLYLGQRGEVVKVLRRTLRARPTIVVSFTRHLHDGTVAHVRVVAKPNDLVMEDQR